MFGIGLPEMILILALALIVVGPDKLPDLARSLARTILDLKKTAEGLKASFREEGNPLDEIRPELEDAARSLKSNLLEQPVPTWDQDTPFPGVNRPSPAGQQAVAPAAAAGYDDTPAPLLDEEFKENADQQQGPADPGAPSPSGSDEAAVAADADDRK